MNDRERMALIAGSLQRALDAFTDVQRGDVPRIEDTLSRAWLERMLATLERKTGRLLDRVDDIARVDDVAAD